MLPTRVTLLRLTSEGFFFRNCLRKFISVQVIWQLDENVENTVSNFVQFHKLVDSMLCVRVCVCVCSVCVRVCSVCVYRGMAI